MPDYLPLYQPDQLVIDRTERDKVLSALNALEITATTKDRIDEFDLELLELKCNADFEKKLDAAPVTDLDALLFELRRPYEEARTKPPLLAKNRTMTSRFGAYPETQSHTDFDPSVLATAPQELIGSTNAGAGIRVGVLDTKLDDHEKLRGRVDLPKRQSTFLPYPERPRNSYLPRWEEGHATFVAGCIAARAPGARIVVRDVLDYNGEAPAWETVKEMANFLHDSIAVLVLAIGCRTDDQDAPKIVVRAIERLKEHMLIIAAAGNHGATKGMKNGITKDSPTWPAALPDVIAVGATRPDGTLAEYSPRTPWVYCTGPGDDVLGTYLTGEVRLRGGNTATFNGFARWEGTSFAAAALGGAVAAAMERYGLKAKDALDKVLAVNPEFHKV